jgi:hypothetical protein
VAFLAGLAVLGTVAREARAEVLTFSKDFEYTNSSRMAFVFFDKFDTSLGTLNEVLFDFQVQSAPQSIWSVDARPDPIMVPDPTDPLGYIFLPGTATPYHRVDFSVLTDVSLSLKDFNNQGAFARQTGEARGQDLSLYEGPEQLMTTVTSVLGADFVPSGRILGDDSGEMIGTVRLAYDFTPSGGNNPIPEPPALVALAGLGVSGWLLRRRRR